MLLLSVGPRIVQGVNMGEDVENQFNTIRRVTGFEDRQAN